MLTRFFSRGVARAGAAVILTLAAAGVAAQNPPRRPAGNPAKGAAPPAEKKKPAAAKDPQKKGQGAAAPEGTYFEAIYQIPTAAAGEVSADAAEIKDLLGDPKPFTLKARDADAIVVYGPKPRAKLSADEAAILAQIDADIRSLASHQPRILEVPIPHAAALGDVARKVQALNYHDIKVEAVGSDKIWVVLDRRVPQSRIDAFQRDLLRLSRSPRATSPVARVFFLDAPDAAAVWGGAASKPGGSGDGSGAAKDQKAGAGKQGDASSAKATADVKPGAAIKAADKKVAEAKDSGDDAPDPSAADAAPADPQSGGSTGAAGNSLSVKTVNNDLLVFTDERPGDDAAVSEAKRTLAAIDFPRPEMIINTFSFQTSTSNPNLPYEVTSKIRDEIGIYNDRLQAGLNSAWRYLSDQIAKQDASYFQADFKSYLTQYYVAEAPLPAPLGTVASGRSALSSADRTKLGVCETDKYCLGYTSLFHPLRPNLTDLLLAVIAASQPDTQIENVITSMELGRPCNVATGGNLVPSLLSRKKKPLAQTSGPGCVDQTRQTGDSQTQGSGGQPVKANDSKSPDSAAQPSAEDKPCEQKDQEEISADSAGLKKFPFNCFRQTATRVFGKNFNLIGPLRAAVADFLFHYKMSVQYPHEFSFYDLSHSAQELNSALNPLILAFNRDLAAALGPLRDVAKLSRCRNGFFGFLGHGTCFINNGIISVRTISGKETTVDTVTQNFFDATNPPSITDIVSSIGNAESNLPKVLKANLTANEAAVLIGALNSVKPAEVKVGREFKIDITPRSLSGASAAELNIVMNTQEQGEPTLYRDSKSDADDMSRVAQHTTQTKVRLESAKLFEVSSFTATLERGRRNVPLILPLVELPYVGSFLSFPVPGAKQYHSSTAIMSAVVVPTAADVANAVVFTNDRMVVANDAEHPNCDLTQTTAPNCTLVSAASTFELGTYSVRDYHKAMVRCFGEGNKNCGGTKLSGIFPEGP